MAPQVASLPGGPAPEPAVEWLFFQALAGALPPDFDADDAAARQSLADRFLPYLEKSLREAKLRTNWTDVDEAYERAIRDYASDAIGSAAFMAGFWRDIQPFVKAGLVNSLSQTLVKLAAPGIPDIYQGTEGFDASLVDPDNRRMPDFAGLSAKTKAPPSADFETTKTALIRSVLALRKHQPDLFAFGRYRPLATKGLRADNVLAFERRHGTASVLTIVPRLVYDAAASDRLHDEAYWDGTTVILPEDIQLVEDALLRQRHSSTEGALRLADLFRERPFALLTANI